MKKRQDEAHARISKLRARAQRNRGTRSAACDLLIQNAPSQGARGHFCDYSMKAFKKADFPPAKVRRFLEPGPVVLISSACRGRRNIMTCGWHMILETEPSLVGCYIWDENCSEALIRSSRECVINVPTFDLVSAVVGIGNSHGSEVDKFKKFRLTALEAEQVGAPLIAQCYANFECKLVDSRLIKRYSLFVFKVVKAHVATSPRYPTTIHYRGEGVFMVSGRNLSYRRLFRPANL